MDFRDITYTMINVSIWSTIEQSIGIICACLVTYRPLLGRLRSFYSRTTDNPRTQGDTSKSTEMPNLRPRPPRRSSDPSTAGFARLYEDDLERGFKTHIIASRTPGLQDVPKVIMKSQTIEQHHEITKTGSTGNENQKGEGK